MIRLKCSFNFPQKEEPLFLPEAGLFSFGLLHTAERRGRQARVEKSNHPFEAKPRLLTRDG